MSHPDVLVIGGGLHGLSAAFQIARRGRRVRVLEKEVAGAHASGFSAGGVRSLGRHTAEIPLALAALELWHDLAALLGEDGGFQPTGQIKVAETPEELALLEARVASLRAQGYTHEALIGPEALRRWLPALAPHCVGGILCERDGFAEPYRTTLAFRRAALALGAEMVEGARVTHLERRDGLWRLRCANGAQHEAPIVVNAAGAWAGRVARAVGEDIPLGFNAFMMMLTAPMAPFIAPVVGATGRPISFKQTASGQVMIGGGHKGVGDLATGRVTLDVERLAFSARTALDLFPILAGTRMVHAWAGIEGVLPDDIPVIGRSATAEGLVHAFGFCGHGFALAPCVGGIVADLALRGGTDLPIAAFAPERFGRAAPAMAAGQALAQPAG